MLRRTLRGLDERLLGGRLQGAYWHASDLGWRARWLAAGRPFAVRRVDWFRLSAEAPPALHAEIAAGIRAALGASDNVEYFTSLRNYGRSDWALHGVDHPFELFPPNIAALDFLVQAGVDRERTVVLDFGSGLGHLVVYLRRMGFARAIGYDNFSQVSEASSRRFLSSFGIEDGLVSRERLVDAAPAIVIVGSLPWSFYADDIRPVLAAPSLRYALLDCYYPCPTRIPGLRRVAEYRRLMRVFEREPLRAFASTP